jgi:WXG100 family type VII secretion target
MAGNIKVTPEQLINSSNLFRAKSQETMQTISKLSQEVDRLSSSWEGAAHSAFFEKFKELKKPLNQFVEVTGAISKQLSDVAKTMQEVDKQIASKLR